MARIGLTLLLSVLTSSLFIFYLIMTEQVSDVSNLILSKGLSSSMSNQSIYDFTVKDADGNNLSMNEYKGKVLLIVNVASKCGFTPQYQALQNLYEKYGSKGLEVLAFPCNQFGYQEPESNKNICSFAAEKYHVTFKMMDKVNVNGKNEIPLFTYLKSQATGLVTNGIKWNFTKILVDRNGRVVARYSPITNPESISSDIEALL